MAETDMSWFLEGPVKPLPISLPFPTWIKSMQVVSLQFQCPSEQAVYTLLPSAPEPASWAGTGTESLKTLCIHHCDRHCLSLLLGVDEDALGTVHIHIPSLPRGDRNISAAGNQGTQAFI